MATVLFVSTPCYGGVCLAAYAESLLRLQRMCATRGIQMMLDTTENESLVHRARSLAVARFMYKTQAEYFLFVDADVHFEPESVIRLVKADQVRCQRQHTVGAVFDFVKNSARWIWTNINCNHGWRFKPYLLHRNTYCF